MVAQWQTVGGAKWTTRGSMASSSGDAVAAGASEDQTAALGACVYRSAAVVQRGRVLQHLMNAALAIRHGDCFLSAPENPLIACGK